MSGRIRIAALPGDGIGPEVTRAALAIARTAADAHGVALDVSEHAIGGAAIDATGDPFPDATRDAVLGADAVLLGAVGGPAWDDVAPDRRPEQGLLRLRTALGGFANLRPVTVAPALAARSPLRPEIVAGTDLVIVRELLGDVYFGAPRAIDGAAPERDAYDTMRYREPEIVRVAHVAFALAEQRAAASGRAPCVTSVDKANVLASSRLWREVVTQVQAEAYPHVALDHLYVDNAAMQLARRPTSFDVVLTGNLFGDILSDLAAALGGSLGVLPSASVGGAAEAGGAGLFEPIHGSAPDIAGHGVANPIGAILSVAMLFEHTGHAAVGASIRAAVDAVVDAGLLTPDLGGTATTDAVADAISAAILVPASASVLV